MRPKDSMIGISLDVFDGLGPPVFPTDRPRHWYVIGASQSGKTSLVLNCVNLDDAVIVLDPHGTLANPVASMAPKDRLVYVDKDHPICINLLQFSHLSKSEKANELSAVLNSSVGAFNPDQYKISVAMHKLIRRAVRILPDDTDIKQLGEFMVSKNEREKHKLDSFWSNFHKLGELRDSAQRVDARLSLLYDDEHFNPFVCGENEFSIEEIVKDKKIVVFDLFGLDDDCLMFLGNAITYAIKDYVRHRARHVGLPFNVYVDEFQNFINSSFDSVFVESLKFGVTLTLCHQAHSQIDRKTLDIALGNCAIKSVFQCGDNEARRMARELGWEYEKVAGLQRFECLFAIDRDIHYIETFPPPKVPEYVPGPPVWFMRDEWFSC